MAWPLPLEEMHRRAEIARKMIDPEKRRMIARRAAARRWLKLDRGSLDRVNAWLHVLAEKAHKAYLSGDDEMLLRVSASAATWTRIGIVLERNGTIMGPALELEGDAVRLLEESRARREKALAGD